MLEFACYGLYAHRHRTVLRFHRTCTKWEWEYPDLEKFALFGCAEYEIPKIHGLFDFRIYFVSEY